MANFIFISNCIAFIIICVYTVEKNVSSAVATGNKNLTISLDISSSSNNFESRKARFSITPLDEVPASSTHVAYDNPFDHGQTLDERLQHTTLIDYNSTDSRSSIIIKCNQIDGAYCNYPDIPLIETNSLDDLLSKNGLKSGQCPATHQKRATFDCLNIAPSTVEVTCCVPIVHVSRSICDHLNNNEAQQKGVLVSVNAIFRTCSGRYFMIIGEYVFEFDEEFHVVGRGPAHVAWLTAGGVMHGNDIVGAGTQADCRTAFAKSNGNLILVDIEGRRETQHVTRQELGLRAYETIVGLYCPREGYCTVLTEVSPEIKTELGLINWYVMAPQVARKSDKQKNPPWLIPVEPKNHLNALYNVTATEYLENRRLLVFIDGRMNVYFFESDGRLALYSRVPGGMNPVNLLKLIPQCDSTSQTLVEKTSLDDGQQPGKTIIIYAPYDGPKFNKKPPRQTAPYVTTHVKDEPTILQSSHDSNKDTDDDNGLEEETPVKTENNDDENNSDYSKLYSEQLKQLAHLLNHSPVIKLYGKHRKKIVSVLPDRPATEIHVSKVVDKNNLLPNDQEEEEEQDSTHPVRVNTYYTPPITNKILADHHSSVQPGKPVRKLPTKPDITPEQLDEANKISAYMNRENYEHVDEDNEDDEDAKEKPFFEPAKSAFDEAGPAHHSVERKQNLKKPIVVAKIAKPDPAEENAIPEKSRFSDVDDDGDVDPSAFPGGPVPMPPPVPPDWRLPADAQHWHEPYKRQNEPSPFFGGPPPFPGGFGLGDGFLGGVGDGFSGGGYSPPQFSPYLNSPRAFSSQQIAGKRESFEPHHERRRRLMTDILDNPVFWNRRRGMGLASDRGQRFTEPENGAENN